ncbi:MAG: hypothetical protein CL677_02255 [Bdellovibrionaceae bacterium]|nr:hypothetical protein [Pseudobdellovibrionaceae bacterium]|tara:strand:- start:168360 stop:168815 length:456 start_codon:yes stop_codon:yes gene_type:complete
MKIAIFLIFTSTLPQALIAQAATVNDNLVENVSEKTVEEVSSSIQAEIKRRGLRLFSVIDHSANAKSVGKELPETVLILFGNPKVGTEFMIKSNTIGIDLPQKILIRSGKKGKTHIYHNSQRYLGVRHNLNHPALNKVDSLLLEIVKNSSN